MDKHSFERKKGAYKSGSIEPIVRIVTINFNTNMSIIIKHIFKSMYQIRMSLLVPNFYYMHNNKILQKTKSEMLIFHLVSANHLYTANKDNFARSVPIIVASHLHMHIVINRKKSYHGQLNNNSNII